MTPPEPCLKGRCYSPVACNGWGYCRERNYLTEAESELDSRLSYEEAIKEMRRRFLANGKP